MRAKFSPKTTVLDQFLSFFCSLIFPNNYRFFTNSLKIAHFPAIEQKMMGKMRKYKEFWNNMLSQNLEKIWIFGRIYTHDWQHLTR